MSFAALAGRLTRRAATLAEARTRRKRHRRAGTPHDWHQPRLLWPLFTDRSE